MRGTRSTVMAVAMVLICATVPTAAAEAVATTSDASLADSTATALSPRGALLRSALLPGWGQLAIGHPYKAALFAGAAAGWLGATVVESQRVGEAPTPQEHEDRAARRNTRVLYYCLTATLAALDAYVDAHLEDFDIEPAGLDLPAARLTYRF